MDSIPVTENGCRALLRKLDMAATSFASTEDLRRFLLREALRRLKPGVQVDISPRHTTETLVETRALPELDKRTHLPKVPKQQPLDTFPVTQGVRALGIQTVRQTATPAQ